MSKFQYQVRTSKQAGGEYRLTSARHLDNRCKCLTCHPKLSAPDHHSASALPFLPYRINLPRLQTGT